MPAGDRTGPYGAGPLTGRGMGYCAGLPYPGWMNRGWGGGFGRGWGAGRGFLGFGRRSRRWRNAFFAPAYPPAPQYSREAEVEFLKEQASYLESMLEDIRKRLKELEKEE